MTPEPDNVTRLIRQATRRGPLGFAENDQPVEPSEVRQVAIVKGRKGKIETPGGQKRVQGQARLVIAPKGLVSIPGGEGAPISVNDLGKILETETIVRVTSALSKDRKRRKEKLQDK